MLEYKARFCLFHDAVAAYSLSKQKVAPTLDLHFNQVKGHS